ncbi:hypothetical protein PRIPAC_73235, partial [Pristionchus pacificus]|uniref:Uncharacterized protein n=1 Tax=Pristionchus pacificus TaxID=54126 RepID=A0A2A6CRM7_PRIPA
MVVFHHAAGFRGNNIIKKPGRLTSFSELVLSLRDGTRSFIIPVPDIFNDEVNTLRFLLGDQQLQFVPDSVEVLRQFCAEPSIATLLHSGAYSEMNMIESPCRIAEIKPTEVNGIREKNFDSYSQIVPSYFLLPKSTDFTSLFGSFLRMYRELNKRLQIMVTHLQIDGLWTRRMEKRLRNFNIDIPFE